MMLTDKDGCWMRSEGKASRALSLQNYLAPKKPRVLHGHLEPWRDWGNFIRVNTTHFLLTHAEAAYTEILQPYRRNQPKDLVRPQEGYGWVISLLSLASMSGPRVHPTCPTLAKLLFYLLGPLVSTDRIPHHVSHTSGSLQHSDL